MDSSNETLTAKQNILEKYSFINTFFLKLIAILTMTIDHVGACFGIKYQELNVFFTDFFPMDTYTILRSIGRLAFPIFCYLIVEGLYHTRDVKKYALRLFIFAFISQIPFNMMLYKDPFYPRYKGMTLNVYFTLCIGLLAIAIARACYKVYQEKQNTQYMYIGIITILCAMTLAQILKTDYGAYGVLVITVFFLFRNNPLMLIAGQFFAMYFMRGKINIYFMLALIPILLHNHKKGPGLKYLFYAYYPAHMLILYLIYTII